jgi:hypothetical protein
MLRHRTFPKFQNFVLSGIGDEDAQKRFDLDFRSRSEVGSRKFYISVDFEFERGLGDGVWSEGRRERIK